MEQKFGGLRDTPRMLWHRSENNPSSCKPAASSPENVGVTDPAVPLKRIRQLLSDTDGWRQLSERDRLVVHSQLVSILGQDNLDEKVRQCSIPAYLILIPAGQRRLCAGDNCSVW